MNDDLRAFFEKTVKIELKQMYSYDIEDPLFGVETDRYHWSKRVLSSDISLVNMLDYFDHYFSKAEKVFIKRIKELMTKY